MKVMIGLSIMMDLVTGHLPFLVQPAQWAHILEKPALLPSKNPKRFVCLHHTIIWSIVRIHTCLLYTSTSKRWPTDPLFYMSAPSVTDDTIAPDGHENLFILIPIAPDLEDTEAIREHYFSRVLERIKMITGEDIQDRIVYKRSYCVKDFKADYHSFQGNAYGLANTCLLYTSRCV